MKSVSCHLPFPYIQTKYEKTFQQRSHNATLQKYKDEFTEEPPKGPPAEKQAHFKIGHHANASHL